MRTLFKGGSEPTLEQLAALPEKYEAAVKEREPQLEANDVDFYEHPIFNTDSYKVSMSVQYPEGTTEVYSYIEARAKGEYSHTVFFGLQAYIKRYLMKPLTKAQLEAATDMWTKHGEGNINNPELQTAWNHIIETHGGYLPVEIQAPEEGMVIPIGLPLVTIKNTDPQCYWLTTWLETSLLRAVWYPTTVATQSKSMKNVFKRIFRQANSADTSYDPSKDIAFNLHDFGCRGVSSNESGGLGGAAHLINFWGTDTFAGAITTKIYYDAEIGNNRYQPEVDPIIGGWATSVPATEHSTMTSWEKQLAIIIAVLKLIKMDHLR
jgi:nicotinamide phosphoribosyltransferase